MSYEWIDQIISAWATDFRLTVYREYKDVEVRSVDVVSSSGAKCQIWIDRLRHGAHSGFPDVPSAVSSGVVGK